MITELEPERLNVTDKTRSNLFSWRGQFTPQFVDYLLETFARPGQTVLDPFCGSGTVLQEAAAHRMRGIGLEINPAAYAMAKFFSFSGFDSTARKQLIHQARDVVQVAAIPFQGCSLFQDSSDYRECAANLLDLARAVLDKSEDKQLRLLLLLALFRAESSRNGDLVQTVARSLQFLSDELLKLPEADFVPIARLSDARNAHLHSSGPADLIVTSPPYINVFNYHQNYRALLELFGFDMLKVANSEIGSNRKNRGNRFLTVVQYCLDLEQSLSSFAESLAPNGILIMVLGRESRVRGIPFGNSEIAKALMIRNGAYARPAVHERVFVNRFGQAIYEDILVARRSGSPNASENARDLARALLSSAMSVATGEVREDIRSALESSQAVSPSPVFDRSALI